jgi:hypothetical protein
MPKEILLSDLIREADWYPRQQLSRERVDDYEAYYRESGPGALPPICVAILPGLASPWLVDGWHRVAAAEKANLDRLLAITQEYPDRWAAFAEAVRLANCGPLSLKPAERGRHVDAFLRQFPEASDRDLARRLGVSHVYVWKRRQKLNRNGRPEDPMLKHSRALAIAWENLNSGCLPSPPEAGQTQTPAILSMGLAFLRLHGPEAEAWLQNLEAAARLAREWVVPNASAGPPAENTRPR